MLGSTAERFFCPALARVSEGLSLSPNVAVSSILFLRRNFSVPSMPIRLKFIFEILRKLILFDSQK